MLCTQTHLRMSVEDNLIFSAQTVKFSVKAATHPDSVQDLQNKSSPSKCSYCMYFKSFLCLIIVCINLCGVVFSEFQQIKV